jgi:hypothetical protein
MPDVRDRRNDDYQETQLVDALRALPLASPDGDGWTRLEVALRARSKASVPPRGMRRRSVRMAYAWPFAAAAAVLAAVLWPQLSVWQEELPAPVADGSDDMRALIAQSQWLERLVAADAIDAVAKDADQLILEQGLRARIQRIDAALVDSHEPDRRLWAARVGTLAQLAEVKWAGRQDSWSAMADTAGSVPAVMWSN